MSFLGDSVVKNPPANTGVEGDAGSIPGSGISPGGGNGPQSSILIKKFPSTEEPAQLQSVGLQRAGQE